MGSARAAGARAGNREGGRGAEGGRQGRGCGAGWWGVGGSRRRAETHLRRADLHQRDAVPFGPHQDPEAVFTLQRGQTARSSSRAAPELGTTVPRGSKRGAGRQGRQSLSRPVPAGCVQGRAGGPGPQHEGPAKVRLESVRRQPSVKGAEDALGLPRKGAGTRRHTGTGRAREAGSGPAAPRPSVTRSTKATEPLHVAGHPGAWIRETKLNVPRPGPGTPGPRTGCSLSHVTSKRWKQPPCPLAGRRMKTRRCPPTWRAAQQGRRRPLPRVRHWGPRCCGAGFGKARWDAPLRGSRCGTSRLGTDAHVTGQSRKRAWRGAQPPRGPRGRSCSRPLPPRGAGSPQRSGLRSAPRGDSVDGKGVALEEKCGGHPCPGGASRRRDLCQGPSDGGDVVCEVSFLRPGVPPRREERQDLQTRADLRGRCPRRREDESHVGP